MAVNNPSSSAKHDIAFISHWPVLFILGGLLCVGGWLYANMLQVLSSQAWFLHSENSANIFAPQNVFVQFPLFWSGRLSPDLAMAFIFAWGSQLIMLISKLGIAMAQAYAVQKFGGTPTAGAVKGAQARMWVWRAISFLVLFLDFWTDWGYAAKEGPGQQFFFVVVVGALVYYAGTIGMQWIVFGIHRMQNS